MHAWHTQGHAPSQSARDGMPTSVHADATQALLDIFRARDLDGNNVLDLNEFTSAMRSLNLDLSDKDFQTLFRIADIDNSGSIELDEFLNQMRLDAIPRAHARPRPLLPRHAPRRSS